VKKIIFWVVLVGALAAPPTLVVAQLLPGLPSLPGMPALNLPSNVTLGNLSVYGGWATNAGMTNLSLSKGNPIFGTMGHEVWDYDYSSFYMAATLPISMGDYGAALFSGSLALPSTSPGRATNYSFAGPLMAVRRWSADSYWATLEGMWAYPLSNTFSALVGFRWDCWQTSFKSPIDEFGGWSAPTDTADSTVNGYIPFVGLLATYRGLNVGAVGMPTTIGQVEVNEVFGGSNQFLEDKGTFTGGYFFEMFADYAMPMPGGLGPGVDADLSLFGKCSFLAVEATPSVSRWNSGVFVGEEDYDFRLQRNLFVLGAKATLKFNLAGILPF
jgi:hypothetical protein